MYEIPRQTPRVLTTLADGVEAATGEALAGQIDTEAAAALSGKDPIARSFAAIRLAHSGGPVLAAHRARVHEVLMSTIETDAVLTSHARAALRKLEPRP